MPYIFCPKIPLKKQQWLTRNHGIAIFRKLLDSLALLFMEVVLLCQISLIAFVSGPKENVLCALFLSYPKAHCKHCKTTLEIDELPFKH